MGNLIRWFRELLPCSECLFFIVIFSILKSFGLVYFYVAELYLKGHDVSYKLFYCQGFRNIFLWVLWFSGRTVWSFVMIRRWFCRRAEMFYLLLDIWISYIWNRFMTYWIEFEVNCNLMLEQYLCELKLKYLWQYFSFILLIQDLNYCCCDGAVHCVIWFVLISFGLYLIS